MDGALDIRQGDGPPAPVPLFRSGAALEVHFDDRRIDFRGDDGDHVYLLSDAAGSITTPPRRPALALEPDAPYVLSGEAVQRGTGRASLFVLEYDRKRKIASHQQRLVYGSFSLAWRTDPRLRSCQIALRLTGTGFLELDGLRLEQREADDGAEILREGACRRGQRCIVIAGCARSGTTLMTAMFRCFGDTHVEPAERPFTDLAALDRAERTIVLKRTAGCWRTLWSAPQEVSILYLVRHPYDVLTSRWHTQERYYVTLERWVNEYRGLLKLLEERSPGPALHIVRYEDLVSRPRGIQAELERLWDLESHTPFDRFHTIPTEVEHPHALGGLRPPDRKSIGKWQHDAGLRDDLVALLASEPGPLRSFLDRFGYEDHGLIGAVPGVGATPWVHRTRPAGS